MSANLLTGLKKLAADQDRLKADRERRALIAERGDVKKRLELALRQLERVEKERDAAIRLAEPVDRFAITPLHASGHGEATAVVVASDWHVEERVGREVGRLNRHNLKIAKARAVEFFQAVVRLVKILGRDIEIKHLVLALLGDWISNDIHEELVELVALPPVEATLYAQSLWVSGIEYLLRELPGVDFVVVERVGNHGRTTETNRAATEASHSLETFLYNHLAAYFRAEKRLTFVNPPGYHAYVRVYDLAVRFHHGHRIKYWGGVGGITIPVLKKIAQWNRGEHADLDVFGHLHQFRDGGFWLCNGSQIGYNAHALANGFDYEPPKQALFLIDKKRGRTATWPIVYSR